jgi:hypothetical protein
MRLILNIFRCPNVHKTRQVKMSPIGCERKNPPEEKFSQSLTARGRVKSPNNKRTTAHHKQQDASPVPIVNAPRIKVKTNGTNSSRKRIGDVVSKSDETDLFMTELLQEFLLTSHPGH